MCLSLGDWTCKPRAPGVDICSYGPSSASSHTQRVQVHSLSALPEGHSDSVPVGTGLIVVPSSATPTHATRSLRRSSRGAAGLRSQHRVVSLGTGYFSRRGLSGSLLIVRGCARSSGLLMLPGTYEGQPVVDVLMWGMSGSCTLVAIPEGQPMSP